MLVRLIGLVGRVFANGPRDQSSVPGFVIPKTQKMVLDASLLNTQHYKVCIKGKVEQSRERSSTVPYTSVWKLLKREPSGRPRLRSPTLLTYFVGNEPELLLCASLIVLNIRDSNSAKNVPGGDEPMPETIGFKGITDLLVIGRP